MVLRGCGVNGCPKDFSKAMNMHKCYNKEGLSHFIRGIPYETGNYRLY